MERARWSRGDRLLWPLAALWLLVQGLGSAAGRGLAAYDRGAPWRGSGTPWRRCGQSAPAPDTGGRPS